MNRDQRLFDLIQLMRDGRLHTASELAAAVGVSTRTIWRDMAMMAQTGLPVTGERGVGYILRAPLMLPPTMLTTDELEALTEGLR
ncbi:MAG: HTH domain-containing protein, partial [Gemmobacter sp.]|nr:HTH domain-containing protein [Gemmobacter sp.]